VRPAVKFWGSMALLLAGETAYAYAYLTYLPWDTHLFYALGIVLLGTWMLYATSLVVRGPLAAAPCLCAFCLALFVGFLRLFVGFLRLDMVSWQLAIVFLGIAAAYLAVVARAQRA